MTSERTQPSTESSHLARFMETFQVAPEAESGLPSIRALIRSLAVTGRLLTTVTADEPCATTIARLLRASEESEGDPKFEARLRAKLGEEKASPWTIPSTWRFSSIEECAAGGGLFVDGDWVESKDQDPGGEIRLTQLADVGDGVFRDRSDRFMNRATAERLNCTFLQRGDILIARMPEPLGRACVFPGERRPCATVVDVAVLRVNPQFFLPEYIALAINSPLVRQVIGGLAAGTTRQRVSRGNLAGVLLPLPPLAEQKRIVAKVDQLMALCDDLEARQTKKRDTSTRLTMSALQALTTAEGPEEFDRAWNRVVENFDVLIDRAEKVDELRKAIVDLASKGILTARTGSAASVLLELRRHERRAAWEAEQLARFKRDGRPPRDGRWKASYEEAPLPATEGLPVLPPGWAYAPIAALGADPFCPVQTGPFGAQLHRSEFTTSGVPVIAVGNLTWNGFSADGIYFISAAKAEQLARYDVQSGDLLFARSGATLGKVCVAPPEARDWRMTGHILRVRLDPRAIRSDLAVLWLWASGAVTEQVRSTIRGGTRPGYNTSLLESIVLPIPPMDEQNEIVAKVEQLMKICDELEALLRRGEESASRLVDAVVQELVA